MQTSSLSLLFSRHMPFRCCPPLSKVNKYMCHRSSGVPNGESATSLHSSVTIESVFDPLEMVNLRLGSTCFNHLRCKPPRAFVLLLNQFFQLSGTIHRCMKTKRTDRDLDQLPKGSVWFIQSNMDAGVDTWVEEVSKSTWTRLSGVISYDYQTFSPIWIISLITSVHRRNWKVNTSAAGAYREKKKHVLLSSLSLRSFVLTTLVFSSFLRLLYSLSVFFFIRLDHKYSCHSFHRLETFSSKLALPYIMLQHLREALLDKLGKKSAGETEMCQLERLLFDWVLDEQDPGKLFCVFKWSDTKKVEILPQTSIRLSAGETVRLNVTYTVFTDNQRRSGTVVATGSFADHHWGVERERGDIVYIHGQIEICMSELLPWVKRIFSSRNEERMWIGSVQTDASRQQTGRVKYEQRLWPIKFQIFWSF